MPRFTPPLLLSLFVLGCPAPSPMDVPDVPSVDAPVATIDGPPLIDVPMDTPSTGPWGASCTFPGVGECGDGYRCTSTDGRDFCAPACEAMTDCTAAPMGFCATVPLPLLDAGIGLGYGTCQYYCELGGTTYACPDGTTCGPERTLGGSVFRLCMP